MCLLMAFDTVPDLVTYFDSLSTDLKKHPVYVIGKNGCSLYHLLYQELSHIGMDVTRISDHALRMIVDYKLDDYYNNIYACVDGRAEQIILYLG